MLAVSLCPAIHKVVHEVAGTAEQFVVVGYEVDKAVELVELLFL